MIVIVQPNIDKNGPVYTSLLQRLRNLPKIQIRIHEEVGTQQTLTEIYLVGDTAALAALLSRPPEDFQCSRRAQILEENDWDAIARRHHDIILRRTPVPERVPLAAGPRPS